MPFSSYLLASKPVFVQNPSYENEFDLHENETVGGTHFHMNGFVLTKTQKTTGKWPILVVILFTVAKIKFQVYLHKTAKQCIWQLIS